MGSAERSAGSDLVLILMGCLQPAAWRRGSQEDEELQRSDPESISSVGKLILGEERLLL